MTISLCMIVRDEESQLARCLDSVAGLVDEMVIVDTGSVDRTREIARSYGARVIDRPWDGSFSTARNASLEAATGDWILILDADEAVTRPELIRQAIDQPTEAEAFCLVLVNFVGERSHEEAVSAPAVRIFRNRPEYRYTRALHEQIMYSVFERDPQALVVYLPSSIEHYGYLNQLVAGRDKIQRNLKLARQEVRRYPRDAFSWYNLAQEYFRLGDWGQAVEAYQKGFPFIETLAAGYAPAMIKHLIVSLLNMLRPDEAIAVASEAKEAYDRYTDLWVLHGLALMQKQEYEAAAEQFRQAAAMGEAAGAFYISDEGVGSYKAAWWLGHCLLNLGRLEEAKASFLESLAALAEAGRYLATPLDGLLTILRLEQVPDDRLLATLGTCVDLADPRWREVLGRHLLGEGNQTLGLSLLEGLTELEAATWLAVGAAMLRDGDLAAARAAWDAVPADDRLRPEADWQRVLADAVAGDLDAAEATVHECEQRFGRCALNSLYEGLVRLWRGEDPASVPAPELDVEAPLQAHVGHLLGLFLQTGAIDRFEASLPALDWVRLSPDRQAAMLGRLYSSMGLADMAIEALSLAVEAGDTSDETLRTLGLCCLRRGRYAEAEAVLGEVVRRQTERGLRPRPGNAALLGYLAALSAQGRDSEAEPLWQELTAASRPPSSRPSPVGMGT